MENFENIIENNSGSKNSLINLRINIDKIEEFIDDNKILEIVEIVKQSFPFTFIGRQKIRRIIDQLDFAFWIKDPYKKYIIVNKLFAESIGLNLNKIEGQHLSDVLIESEAKLAINIDDYIVSSANAVIYETHSKTFSEEMTQNIEFPIRDLEQKVIAIIGYNQKITKLGVEPINNSQEEFDSFENLPNSIIEVTKDDLIINATNKFLFELNLSKEEVIGKTLQEPLGHDFNLELSNKVVIGNQQFQIEKSQVTQGDENTNYFISFNILKDANSNVSSKMYDLIMQHSDEPMFIYSVEDLKFLKVNESALQLYGYSENEFLGMDLTDLYAPEDIQTLVETSSRETLEHGFTGPWRHKKRDGSTVQVEINKLGVDFEGRQAHYNIVKDISKNIEVKKEMQKYKIAFENTGDIIVFADKEGFITFSNNKLQEILLFDPESLKEKPFLSLVSDNDRGKINTNIFHANEIQRVTVDTKLKRADGESVPVTIHSTPMYNEDDEVESFGLVILSKESESLAPTVPQPIKIVKEGSSQINGDFLRNLFHELLTPINVIIGFAQELAESIENPNEEQSESIEIIRDNQENVLELMDNAIQYAQLIQHQIEITPTMVKFVDLIDSIEKNVNKISATEEVAFAYGKISSSLKLLTDKQKLITITSFLVEFAMKITNNNKVYLSAYQEDNGHCTVSIKDERTGISSKLLTSLEEIFNGDEEEVRQKYGISRFMLRHARKLSQLLANKVEPITKFNKPIEYGYILPVKYVDKEGVTINAPKEVTPLENIEKPTSEVINEVIKSNFDSEIVNEKVKVVKQEEAEVVEEIEESEADIQKILGNISCLYIEDQIDSQILFKVQMRDIKELEFATSFEKAIPILKAKQFDLIVVDINLQGEYNGLDAMRAIKRMPGYDNTPIIAVTAYILPGDRERFIKAGFNDFISKPVLRDKLESVIQKVF